MGDRRFSCIFRTVDSALNGLKLVLRHQYVALLFGISCLYEVVLTILDYQMKVRSRKEGEREPFFSLRGLLADDRFRCWVRRCGGK